MIYAHRLATNVWYVEGLSPRFAVHLIRFFGLEFKYLDF
jgi:hypothetical protein